MMRAVSVSNTRLTRCLQQGRVNGSFVDQWAKKLVLKWLKNIAVGHLTIREHLIENRGYEYPNHASEQANSVDDQNITVYRFGEDPEKASIVADIIVHHPSAYRDVLFNGSVGSGEAYMRGSWTSLDLVMVIRLMCANMTMVEKMDRAWFSLAKFLFASLIHKIRSNNKRNARLNIAAHYDLGNDFFRLFLDNKMMYSAAIFPNRHASLDQAAEYKLAHICRRLQLKATDHLLEIGSGWGGMATYAAKQYSCRVTTTTISKEQYDYTCELVKREGLEGKVTVLLQDYRNLAGQFDKLVSVEMIEAVGHKYYPLYFSTCSKLLKKNGLMLIQAITIADQRYQFAKNATDFIQRYIFPGGALPSLSVIAQNVAEHSDMQMVGVEDITPHYAKTLAAWRERFMSRLEQVKQQGFDDLFIRMWEFYLCYCQGGFDLRAISTVQVLIARPQWRDPVLKTDGNISH